MNRFQMMKISILRNVDFLFICPAISCKHTASRCVFVMSNQTVALAHKLNFDEISGRECPKKAFKLNGKVCQQFRWKQKPRQKCEGMCLKKIVFRATWKYNEINVLAFWNFGFMAFWCASKISFGTIQVRERLCVPTANFTCCQYSHWML